MRQIMRDEIESIYDYANHRESVRDKTIARKKNRTLALGPLLNISFEGPDLVRYYIQEAAWAERILDEDELNLLIRQYNQLLPKGDKIIASVIVNIPEKEDIQTVLHRFAGFENGEPLWLEFSDDQKLTAQIEASETTAPQPIYFAEFSFGTTQKNLLKKPVTLAVKHLSYSARVTVPENLCDVLFSDLE